MIEVGNNAKIHINWKVSPYDYSKEKEKSIIAKASKKYSIPKDRIRVIPDFLTIYKDGKEISLTSDVVTNIQNPEFQVKLFNDWLKNNKIEDCDFELVKKIDSQINSKIDYNAYEKYKRYSIKWIKWDNFLSYGPGNYFDFTTLDGLVLLNGEPANQSGKTTFAIDLIHFLLFGKIEKYPTLDKIFNKHIPEAQQVVVEGCIEIDGIDYIIKRVLSRPALSKRTAKSKTTQKVEYYRVVGDKKEALDDYVENQNEENSIQTNKAIKEAIGRESDFDLIISITESNLDDLIKKKETERGRLLSRWIGLLPIEEKDVLAREQYNTEVKPYLISNRYDTETLLREIEAYNLSIKDLKKQIKNYKKQNEELDKEIDNLEKSKSVMLSSKQTIDQNLLNIDITTLNNNINESVRLGKEKSEKLKEINKEIEEIGDIQFLVADYDKLVDNQSKLNIKKGTLGEQYKNIKNTIQHLKTSEYCPTCGRKLDNVDNSAKIKENEDALEKVTNEGKETASKLKTIAEQIESMKDKREKYTRKSQLIMQKSALELNVEQLRSKYKDLTSTLKEYNKNSDAIDKNNQLDISIRNTTSSLTDKRNTQATNNRYISDNENTIKNYTKEIDDRNKLIAQIKEENHLVKNWKIYLEMIGKNGISKMVLRETLPIINARLSQLLADVCDFDVEIKINDKNEVMFYIIKDGVMSDLSGGSGFEKTAASLALRCVLGDISSFPKPNFCVCDELLGRVASSNYDNMHHLYDKMLESYDFIIQISHLEDIKDWHSKIISVNKKDNISHLSVSAK